MTEGRFEKGRWIEPKREPIPSPLSIDLKVNVDREELDKATQDISKIIDRVQLSHKDYAALRYYRQMNLWERIRFCIHPGSMRR